MGLKEDIKTFFSRIREKHKLTFSDEATYREKWSLRVSPANLFSLFALYTIVLAIGVMLLFRYTPLQSLVLESDLYENLKQIDENEDLIDSLYIETKSNERLMDDLKRILHDQPFDDSVQVIHIDSSENYQPDFTKSTEDSILRAKVEAKDNRGLAHSEPIVYDFFFAPVNGIVSQSINTANKHYGVDVVTKAEEPIKACLEGTIILTGWTQDEGKIVVIQHHSTMISIYKHCSSILKKEGAQVQAGDPIAIVGNSGELTSGPHLHFELWKNGRVINPEDYISF